MDCKDKGIFSTNRKLIVGKFVYLRFEYNTEPNEIIGAYTSALSGAG